MGKENLCEEGGCMQESGEAPLGEHGKYGKQIFCWLRTDSTIIVAYYAHERTKGRVMRRRMRSEWMSGTAQTEHFRDTSTTRSQERVHDSSRVAFPVLIQSWVISHEFHVRIDTRTHAKRRTSASCWVVVSRISNREVTAIILAGDADKKETYPKNSLLRLMWCGQQKGVFDTRDENEGNENLAMDYLLLFLQWS